MEKMDELWSPVNMHMLLFRKKRFIGQHTYSPENALPNFNEMQQLFSEPLGLFEVSNLELNSLTGSKFRRGETTMDEPSLVFP